MISPRLRGSAASTVLARRRSGSLRSRSSSIRGLRRHTLCGRGRWSARGRGARRAGHVKLPDNGDISLVSDDDDSSATVAADLERSSSNEEEEVGNPTQATTTGSRAELDPENEEWQSMSLISEESRALFKAIQSDVQAVSQVHVVFVHSMLQLSWKPQLGKYA